jgi:hypothetical protein
MPTALKDNELFVTTPALTTGWAASGAQTIATGYYVPIFRTHVLGMGDQTALSSGVTFVGTSTTAHYFHAGDTTRDSIDPSATTTGANGTALVSGATIGATLYSGSGAITGASCAWDQKPGATVPGIVFVQIFRPVNSGGVCMQ